MAVLLVNETEYDDSERFNSSEWGLTAGLSGLTIQNTHVEW